jgi:hypothetical protein
MLEASEKKREKELYEQVAGFVPRNIEKASVNEMHCSDS